MGGSWRSRSVPPGGICPLCSTHHFPFCPPPLPSPSFTAPPFRDPWLASPIQPFLPDPWASVGNPPPFRPGFHPPPPYVERESSYKRMRVEEQASIGDRPPFPICYGHHDTTMGRISAEDERRLNLIRDHGKPMEAPPPQLNGRYHMQTQYGVSGTASVHGNGVALPPEAAFGYPNRYLQTNTYEEYHNFPGAGTKRIGAERVGDYNLQFGSPYERSDLERGADMGKHSNAKCLHPDMSFEMTESFRNGDFEVNPGFYTSRLPEERDLYATQQQATYPTSDYAFRGQHESFDHQSHGPVYQTKVTSYALPIRPPYTESNGYHHEQESSYPAYERPVGNRYEHSIPNQHAEGIQLAAEAKSVSFRDTFKPLELQTLPIVEQSTGKSAVQGRFSPLSGRSDNNETTTRRLDQMHVPEHYPTVASTALPLGHPDPPPMHFQVTNSSPSVTSTLFPVLVNTAGTVSRPLNSPAFSEPYALPRFNDCNESLVHPSTEISAEELTLSHQTSSKQYPDEGSQKVLMNRPLQSMTTAIDACNLFKLPHRASRPDHIVIILRGLPGSGKSYLAKALRDLEVENGGNAPRIHSMDDYFMIEVEKKADDNEGSNSSSSSRVKKQTTKKVIEYCYEPDMEEAYRASMLKAFRKTLDEGIFTFIIVDDRNLRVADFAQFWAIAKRSGYEVYLLEAPYRDPMGCAARNVHGFTLDDVQKMAKQWEETPALYLKLDIQSLFHVDDLNNHTIEEVDMDTNDDEAPNLQDKEGGNQAEAKSADSIDGPEMSKVSQRWDSEDDDKEDYLRGVRELGRSKWLKDLEEDVEQSESAKGNVNALSGLVHTYGKNKKTVHWGDQTDNSGFSIGALKKRTTSLIIGPGSGYNLMSNPLVKEQDETTERSNASESKKRFNERLRAERESFRAVFDKRRQRIGGFNNAEDD